MRTFGVICSCSLLLAASARAAIYENVIDIEDEADLLDLEQRGDISADTADTLLALLREGVELNRASRDELFELPGLSYADVDALLVYRKARGRIEALEELAGAGVLTAAQLLRIAPFLRLEPAHPLLPVSGTLHAETRYTAGDPVAPPVLLDARVKGPWELSAGFMLDTTRRQLATPSWDPTFETLLTRGVGYQVNLPRAFAQWRNGSFRVIAGTFTIGFAERLVLDTSHRGSPDGLSLSDDFRRPGALTRTCKLSSVEQPASGDCAPGQENLYVTPDFQHRDSFRGVAGSVEDLSLGGAASLSAHGFLSYQQRSIYQYELFDRRTCPDPNDDSSARCKAPPVYLPDAATRVVYSTLPFLFDEFTGGGHLTLKPSARVTLGLTGYGALPLFDRTRPAQLDFQEWSRWPNSGAFGALGVNAATSWQGLDFFLEAARSFDHAIGNEGGGWGAVQRTTWTPFSGQQLEWSFRYYDLHFANPYGRPTSAPDEFEGQRARNEAGVRLRYSSALGKDWALHARVDLWLNPEAELGQQPAGVTNLYALARADFTRWRVVVPALWVDVRNRNLASNQFGACAPGTEVLTEGQPYLCNGDLYRVVSRVEVLAHPRYLRLLAQAAFTWADDVRYQNRFRTDLSLWAEARSRPLDELELRLKTRYLDQDLSDDAYLEKSSWTFLEASWCPLRSTRVSARYDLYVWLDRRPSTLTRVPNPEHRLMLDVRTVF